MPRKIYLKAEIELIIRANDDVSIVDIEQGLAMDSYSMSDRFDVEDSTLKQGTMEVTDSK